MYSLSRDKSKLDVGAIHAFLRASYWSPNIRRDVVERAIASSEVIGAYVDATGEQVGFARVVTDKATFAWLCDVFVLEAHRGRGLATRMVRELMSDPEFSTLRRWCLATRDAMDVYAPLGFEKAPPQRVFMEFRPPAANWQEPSPTPDGRV
jgi:predicted GNAT family acetyltransferase